MYNARLTWRIDQRKTMQQSLFDITDYQNLQTSCAPVERLVIRVLNLYAGIGGNRKEWEGVKVTAVEYDPAIAEIYKDNFPCDEVIVGDAHEYLLKHYAEFDFIWTSPPCPTHSRIRKTGVLGGRYPAVYPDIKLWEEITLLKHFAKCKWVVENVRPYYTPIIQPTFELDRHCFWSNFYVPPAQFTQREVPHNKINGGNHTIFGFCLDEYDAPDKRKLLRNMVNPEIGNHILKHV